jgi:hypothetical protein
VPASVADRLLGVSASLVTAALALHDAQLRRLRNPPGALRSMIENPGAWGLELAGGSWRAPAELPPAKSPRAVVEEQMRRQHEEYRRLREQFGR